MKEKGRRNSHIIAFALIAFPAIASAERMFDKQYIINETAKDISGMLCAPESLKGSGLNMQECSAISNWAATTCGSEVGRGYPQQINLEQVKSLGFMIASCAGKKIRSNS